ncbi:hypothetical protein KUCAC02_037493 [Chaenocephalus aceratus]|nr:hypothetical protein KUCAC02_037493 [Chaenocephalus aceratus]
MLSVHHESCSDITESITSEVSVQRCPQCLCSRSPPPLQSAATLQGSTRKEPPCSGPETESSFTTTWTTERCLPNHDGSFQMSVDLDVSSFPAEHWGKYRCVFQLSGVKEDHVIVLDPAGIRTNRGNPLLLPLTIGAAVAALALLLIAGVGLLVYRKRNGKKNTPSPASSAELTPLEGQH